MGAPVGGNSYWRGTTRLCTGQRFATGFAGRPLHRGISSRTGHRRWSARLLLEDYHRQYEPILYGWPEGKPHYWCGDRDQSDVWSIARVAVNDLHPTMKPVELVERAIANSSRPGETVLDAFGGSGTTVIACEKIHMASLVWRCTVSRRDDLQRFIGFATLRRRAKKFTFDRDSRDT